jgi:hypothetical protein
MTSFLLGTIRQALPHLDGADLFTIIAPSSMIQPVPMIIGPAIAKIVAFGCTIVPEGL